jgi:hypothetical protein
MLPLEASSAHNRSGAELSFGAGGRSLQWRIDDANTKKGREESSIQYSTHKYILRRRRRTRHVAVSNSEWP